MRFRAELQATGGNTAGFQVDDIVTALNDEAINAQQTFSEVLFQFAPGDTVTVSFVRGSREMQADVTLGERREP